MKPINYPKTLNQDFYRKHHKLFARLLNVSLIGKIMRKLLKINLPLSEKIAFLHPNGFSVHVNGAQFRAELFHYDHISINLYKSFGWLFSVFHWFDIHIANKIAPALNLGFDEYEDPEITVVVFGTVSKGYRNFEYGWYSWEDIRTIPATNAASNLFIQAAILANNYERMAYMSRGIISYNTSFLTYNDVITEAGLRLSLANPVNYNSDFEFDNLIVTSHAKVTSFAFPSNDLTTDDYDVDMFGTVPFYSLTWHEYTTDAPMIKMFYLNEDGLSYIKREAHTAFGFMVEQDFINEDPASPSVIEGYDTTYTLTVPTTGSTFVFLYYSLDSQIVMNL